VVAAGVEPELVSVACSPPLAVLLVEVVAVSNGPPEPVVGVACTPPLTVLLVVEVVAVSNGPPEPVVTVIIMVLSVASFMLVKTPPVTDAGAEARLTLMAAFV
jgi:hypothetical protein